MKRQKRSKKTIIIFMTLIVIALAGTSGFYGIKQHQKANIYSQAQKCFQQRDYSTAKKLFIQLGSYKDSSGWITKCDSQPELDSAAKLMKQGEYRKAREIFQKYRLEENSNECTYQIAISYADAKEYAKSLQELEKIPSYKDVTKKMRAVTYDYALLLYNKQQYTTAQICFQNVGDYKDAADFVEKCNLGIKYESFNINDSYLGSTDPSSTSLEEIYTSMEKWFEADFYGTWYSETGNTLKIDKYSINDIPYQITSSIINSHPEFYYKYKGNETIHHFSFSSATDSVKGDVKQIIFDDYTWYYSVGGEELKELIKQWDIIAAENEKEAELFKKSLLEESIKNSCKNNILDYFNKEGKDKMEQTITAFNSWMISNFKATISDQICYIECDISRTWSFGLNTRHIAAQYLIDNAGNIQRTSISYQ